LITASSQKVEASLIDVIVDVGGSDSDVLFIEDPFVSSDKTE